MDLKMEMTCEIAPVQIEGTINGKPFYFRSRYKRWTMTIVHENKNPVFPAKESDVLFYREKEYGENPFDASSMPQEEAYEIVRECCRSFESGVNK